MERLRLVTKMNDADSADGAEGGDGDQHTGHWLMMLRLTMMGIFPAIKMMVVFSKDICDISAYGIFLEGINYIPLPLLSFLRLFIPTFLEGINYIYHFLFYYSYVCLSLFLISANLCLYFTKSLPKGGHAYHW